MSLSQDALNKIEEVRRWVLNQLESPGSHHIFDVSTDRGKITLARVLTIGALALMKTDSRNKHIFELEKHWNNVSHELKILSPLFYKHVDLRSNLWTSVLDNMASRYYRTNAIIDGGKTYFQPELIESLETFRPSDIPSGVNYPKDVVLEFAHIADGSLDKLSGNTNVSSINLVGDRKSIKIDISDSSGEYFEYEYEGEPITFSIDAIPEDVNARVINGEDADFLNNGTPVILRFKIIAENGKRKDYGLIVRDA